MSSTHAAPLYGTATHPSRARGQGRVTLAKLPYRLNLTGIVDDVPGIEPVQVSLDDGKFEKTGTTFWRWAKTLELRVSQHHVARRRRARKAILDNGAEDSDVWLPFEPGVIELLFQSTRYLSELLQFTETHLQVGRHRIDARITGCARPNT